MPTRRITMPFAKNVAVLMYHHVMSHGGSLTVAAGQFERQIQGLAENGYCSLTANQFAAFMAGEAVPKKSVVLTFDDGYLDNWVYAHPILKRYGMSGILFVITGLIGNGPVRLLQGRREELPACPPHHEAKKRMFGAEPDSVMLRWSEIHEMLADGTFEIHSHTHTHRRWDLECKSTSEKNENMHRDLHMSRQVLTEQLGQSSSHLCWPQGYFDPDYQRIAQELGFRHLYTTDARGQNIPYGNTDHIYRFAVRNRSYPWLRQRLWLATHPVWGPVYNKWKARSDARKEKR